MALINCPNCNKQISDQAKACVGCGHPLTDAANAERTELHCPECAAVTDASRDVCPNCGYPLNAIAKKENRKKRSAKKIVLRILAVCLILFVAAAAFLAKIVINEKYKLEIGTATDEIMYISAEAEEIGSQICAVWKNAIIDKHNADTAKYTGNAKGFDEALSNLFSDEEFTGKIASLRKKQEKIDAYLVTLSNPPREFRAAHDKYKELYYAYSDYVDFVISSKGSYNTYTEGIAQKASVLMERFREMKVELLANSPS